MTIFLYSVKIALEICKYLTKKLMTRHPFHWERKYLKQGYNFVIGIDEAGRGPIAGPVVAVAACLRKFERLKNTYRCEGAQRPRQFQNYHLSNEIASPAKRDRNDALNLIRDSKTLSEKQRESLYDFILEHFYVGVGICDHKMVDRVNILQASFLAMKKAIASLMSFYPLINTSPPPYPYKGEGAKRGGIKYFILVDGNKPIPNCSYNQQAIVNGDRIVKSISAASIIAKVTRDRIMRKMHEIYPEYNFIKHKGYGTKLHFKMIEKHGPCPIHRISFEPVKSWTKRGKR